MVVAFDGDPVEGAALPWGELAERCDEVGTVDEPGEQIFVGGRGRGGGYLPVPGPRDRAGGSVFVGEFADGDGRQPSPVPVVLLEAVQPADGRVGGVGGGFFGEVPIAGVPAGDTEGVADRVGRQSPERSQVAGGGGAHDRRVAKS